MRSIVWKLLCFYATKEAEEGIHAPDQQPLREGRGLLHWPEIGEEPVAVGYKRSCHCLHKLLQARRREEVEQEWRDNCLKLLMGLQRLFGAQPERNRTRMWLL